MKLFHDQSTRKYGTGPGSTPGSAVRHASVARHIADCAMWPDEKKFGKQLQNLQ